MCVEWKEFDSLEASSISAKIKATDNIDFYFVMIQKLLDDGYAYISGGNVYFDTSKLDDYYKLTNHNAYELISGARDDVEEDTNKRNKTEAFKVTLHRGYQKLKFKLITVRSLAVN